MTTSSQTVVVIARWHAREAALGEVLAHLAELRPQSLSEPGCLGYDIFQSRDDPAVIVLIETYRDDAALTAHRESDHFGELVLGRVLPLLVDRQVEILHPAALS